MPARYALSKRKRVVILKGMASSAKSNVQALPSEPVNRLENEPAKIITRTEELHDKRPAKVLPSVPALFSSRPLLRDELQTETSISQEETVDACLPYLLCAQSSDIDHESHAFPRLKRQSHIEFLHGTLGQYSHYYTAYDASRPWVVYWALAGLCFLGEDVSPYRER